MGRKSRWEYFRAIFTRYRKAEKEMKSQILDEFCANTGYNRKYAIWKLNGCAPERSASKRHPGGVRYDGEALRIIELVWERAGYPWSRRLKEILRQWMPWIRRRFDLKPEQERQILAISARQIDRRLQRKRRGIQRRIYGRTKPGKILKHHIAIRAQRWNVRVPGFTEVDLVSHSGNNAAGDFAYSVNQTDILTGWVETRAVLGKREFAVVQALTTLEKDFPFRIRGIDSDNGSEFINKSLYEHCRTRRIQFTRGRPYAKQDNAHIEQKNWTHVRRLMRWDRYDSLEAVDAMNELYAKELRLMMNLFQPSVKLQRKVRVGSRLQRLHDAPQTPLDRLIRSGKAEPKRAKELLELKARLDPFDLSEKIERKLQKIWRSAQARTWERRPRVGAKPLGPRREGPPLARLGFQRRYNFNPWLDSSMA